MLKEKKYLATNSRMDFPIDEAIKFIIFLFIFSRKDAVPINRYAKSFFCGFATSRLCVKPNPMGVKKVRS